jgi:hypothetical protein
MKGMKTSFGASISVLFWFYFLRVYSTRTKV